MNASNIHQHEWKYAWHEARYGRRNMSDMAHVGPMLRMAVRVVQRQGRDELAARQSMALKCGGRAAFIFTHFAKA